MQDTVIENRSKTYEQYLEEIKPDIYAHEGEIIKCQSDHQMGVFACTTYVNEDVTSFDIDAGSSAHNYMPGDPTACACGSPFALLVTRGPVKYSTVVRFWMDGEWRERKYK